MVPLTLLLAAACSPETGFSSQNIDPVAPSGDAVVEVTPVELSFADAQIGVLYAQEITAASLGTDDLLIYTVQIVDDATSSFEIGNGQGTETISVPPGDTTSFLVHLTLSDDSAAYASVVLQTNDAAQLTVRIPASAQPAIGDTGDTAR